MFINIMSVITLIGVIAFPFWHKHKLKKEREEEMHISIEALVEVEQEALLENIA